MCTNVVHLFCVPFEILYCLYSSLIVFLNQFNNFLVRVAYYNRRVIYFNCNYWKPYNQRSQEYTLWLFYKSNEWNFTKPGTDIAMPYKSKYFKIIYIIYLLLSFKLILESFFLYLYNFLNQVKWFSILSHVWKKGPLPAFLIVIKKSLTRQSQKYITKEVKIKCS